ncbi:hypothetical protein [Mesorhizobium sp. B2-3-5]|uniref:hypothetical protein n=1 Tax=Mesorhizobium sp. B2-3-5 TaxID=2589958 RepID=UPI0015E3ECBC|nr:hypothetical protein [Mesorhizobium sp. B2-3-5]
MLQNKTARFSAGRLGFGTEPLTGRVLVPELARVPEPERVLAQVPERVLEPEPGREQVRLAWPVQQASSVQPVRAPGPVCWRPVARRVPDVHLFFRKRNTLQPPG